MANNEGTETNPKEPTPLSLEGGTMQLKLSTEPPPAEEKTVLKQRPKSYIKDIINIQKERGGDGEDSTEPGNTQNSSSTPPKEEPKSIITRLEGEQQDKGSEGDKTPPTPEESKDTAGMIIDGFNALFLFFIQIWSKDTDTKDYEVETEEKKKLKHYLSAIFFRAEKKINPIWLFIGLLLVMYIPILRKGHNHRKMVLEQRAKNRPGATIIDGPRKRQRKNRTNDNSDDGMYTPHVEIR